MSFGGRNEEWRGCFPLASPRLQSKETLPFPVQKHECDTPYHSWILSVLNHRLVPHSSLFAVLSLPLSALSLPQPLASLDIVGLSLAIHLIADLIR